MTRNVYGNVAVMWTGKGWYIDQQSSRGVTWVPSIQAATGARWAEMPTDLL